MSVARSLAKKIKALEQRVSEFVGDENEAPIVIISDHPGMTPIVYLIGGRNQGLLEGADARRWLDEHPSPDLRGKFDESDI